MLKKWLYRKNIGCGYLYFYIHLIVEIACFYFLSKAYPKSLAIWFIPFIYDAFAFVPQSIIGYFSDKYPKIDTGIMGIFLLFLAIILEHTKINIVISLLILCIGNAIMHINGAEVTLKNANGCLSHSAIFVAGGSFGVILGKILAIINVPYVFIALLIFTIIPYYLLAKRYKCNNCKDFNYADFKLNPRLIITLAIIVVIIRGYIGYGIPTVWNKTLLQNVIFYFTMGIGKALGGILSDNIGFRKVAYISTIGSIPFLCFGSNYMIISIIGIMFFSMTMSLTLGILVSTLKNNPGLAFGLTTIGLFLGTMPIFFFKVTSFALNISLIIVSSIVCLLILLLISSKEVKS